MEEAKQLFKINFGLSIGMIVFIICEFCVINFTDGGSAGLNGSIWFSNMVLLVALVFGCRSYINGRHVNKQLANAGLVMALGALVDFKMLSFSHVLLYGEMTYMLSGVLMLVAAIMMFMNWSKTKKPAVAKSEIKSDDKVIEVETAAEVKEDAEKSSEDDKKLEEKLAEKKADSDENEKDAKSEKSDSGDKEESSEDEKKKDSEKVSDDKTSEDNKEESSEDKDSSDKKSEESKEAESSDEKKDSDDKEPWIF